MAALAESWLADIATDAAGCVAFEACNWVGALVCLSRTPLASDPTDSGAAVTRDRLSAPRSVLRAVAALNELDGVACSAATSRSQGAAAVSARDLRSAFDDALGVKSDALAKTGTGAAWAAPDIDHESVSPDSVCEPVGAEVLALALPAPSQKQQPCLENAAIAETRMLPRGPPAYTDDHSYAPLAPMSHGHGHVHSHHELHGVHHGWFQHHNEFSHRAESYSQMLPLPPPPPPRVLVGDAFADAARWQHGGQGHVATSSPPDYAAGRFASGMQFPSLPPPPPPQHFSHHLPQHNDASWMVGAPPHRRAREMADHQQQHQRHHHPHAHQIHQDQHLHRHEHQHQHAFVHAGLRHNASDASFPAAPHQSVFAWRHPAADGLLNLPRGPPPHHQHHHPGPMAAHASHELPAGPHAAAESRPRKRVFVPPSDDEYERDY